DPDVLEGHNLYGFDLPFLAARSKLCEVSLALGRDGSELSFGASRNCPLGGYSRPFTPARVRGRHVIDTLFSVQRFDVGRLLERHGLKECARTFGIEEPGRVHIPGDRIAELWASDPETVKTYALHDVRETARLAALVCPAEFYLTQMVPDTYGSAATSGNGEKINSLMVREYLRRGHAVPLERPWSEVAGGFTEVRVRGLMRNVVKCDVESLYPSLMLTMKIRPASDTLDVFLPMLSELTERRMEAKARASEGPYWNGLQNSFKILINSFYGYLGAPFNWNDFEAAERVTAAGREIVQRIAGLVEERGGRVIEIDTDGVYFQAPPGVETREAEETLVAEIGSSLPEGVRLAHDGRYAAMLSLKIKNYVLAGYNGERVFRGSSLRSRADEPFGREFISQAVELLLSGDAEGAGRLYAELTERIRGGLLPVAEFARRERVTAKTFKSAQKRRLAAVAEGTAVGDYVLIYERSNGELGLAESYAGDEDREYLLEKLYKFACRLREAFVDFDTLFPKPGNGQQAFEF
ncbi:MAG: DNA polymerase domain-containing protein, partial [Armatimonadota bacterium]